MSNQTDGSNFPFQPDPERRAQAIRRLQALLHTWGLTMPAFEPLVLDFGLGCYEEIGEIEYWVANEEDAGYCGKFLFVDDGQTCPEHYHRRKHETFFVLKGQVRMVVDGQEALLRQGATLAMPPGRKHRFTGLGPALILEVSQPSTRGDNYFSDARIGEGGMI